MSEPRVRARIERRLRKTIRDSEQLIRDIEWWNTHRTDCPPFDCETDRVRVSLAKRALAAFQAGRIDEFNRRIDDLLAAAGAELKEMDS